MQAFRRDELLPQWHISVARAFGIGLPLAAQLRRWHWNRPAAARTSRPSPGMAGICMHVHPGRGRAARPATSQFQRPLRGNPMPNAFHPRRRLTTLVITSPANGRRGGSKTPARHTLIPTHSRTQPGVNKKSLGPLILVALITTAPVIAPR